MGMGTTILLSEEHPRARGENDTCLAGQVYQAGTSPRTRGKPAAESRGHRVSRNIPAHAGKTSMMVGIMGVTAEHPRARGENPKLSDPIDATIGTSPRTRGKLQ